MTMEGRFIFCRRWPISLMALCFFALPSLAHSQSQNFEHSNLQEFDEKISREIDRDLFEKHHNIFERLDELDLFDRQLYHEVPELPEDAPKETPRPNLDPTYAYLSSGTVVYGAQDNKPRRLGRALFVRVLLTDYRSDKLWVLNSKNDPVLWVYSSDVTDITAEMQMRPQVPTREEFPPATRHHTTDKSFVLRHELSAGVHSIDTNAIKATFNPDLPSANGDVFSYTLYALWDIPLNLGWSVRYEGVSLEETVNDQLESLAWQSFSTGPKATFPLWQKGDYTVELAAEATQGFILNAFYNDEGFEGDFLRFILGARLLRDFSWGKIFASADWIRERTSIDREQFQPVAAPELGRSSTGAMATIGLSFDVGERPAPVIQPRPVRVSSVEDRFKPAPEPPQRERRPSPPMQTERKTETKKERETISETTVDTSEFRKTQKPLTLKASYTLSTRAFQQAETLQDIDTSFQQTSPWGLGLELNYQLSSQFSLTSSAHLSKMNEASGDEAQMIAIPTEYQFSAHLNYGGHYSPTKVHLGTDFERFSSFNVSELNLGAEAEALQHTMTYATAGISRQFNWGSREVGVKGTLSQSIASQSERETLAGSTEYSGQRIKLFIDTRSDSKWSYHFLLSHHLLKSESEDLTMTRIGAGFGFSFY